MPTIHDFSNVTPVAADELLVWDVSAALTGKATVQTIVDSFLATRITGSGTIITNGFNLTLGATGTAALINAAQTFTAQQSMSGGIDFGQNVLNYYGVGTFTPTIYDNTTGGVAATIATATGFYIRIGNVVKIDFLCNGITTTGMTAGNQISIRGTAGAALPFTAKSTTNYRAFGSSQLSNVAFSGMVSLRILAATAYLQLLK